MSDEVPSGRLSQIFDTLTNLQQQQKQTQHQQSHQLQRRSASSSPSSPSSANSGRTTPHSAAAHQFQFHQQQHFSSHAQQYFLQRAQDGHATYVHTFPSAASQTHHHHLHHLLPAHYYHQQQIYSSAQQQQQMSLPPMYASQSLNSSPLLTKRATSFSGNIPLTRPHAEHVAAAMRASTVASASQSTPNSPHLMPRRAQRPPPVPAKPCATALLASAERGTSDGAVMVTAANSGAEKAHNGAAGGTVAAATAAIASPGLAALDADAPWPHFSTLTDHLDVHQVNNYAQAVPEINWQERCLELQLELHRSKNQAGKIRDMLREKVSAADIPRISAYIFLLCFALFLLQLRQLFCELVAFSLLLAVLHCGAILLLR